MQMDPVVGLSLESIAQDASLSLPCGSGSFRVRALIFNLNPRAIGSRFPTLQRTQEWGNLSGDGSLAKNQGWATRPRFLQ
jgi:hypothetical protein